MALLEVRRESPQCFDRIAFVVENHVGRIKIHSNIGPVQFLQELKQPGRGFLAGFKSKLKAET